MTHYAAPVEEMRFVLEHVADFASVRALPGCGDVTSDLVTAILEQAGRFGTDVLAPINQNGDTKGAVFDAGGVRTPEGFAEAYRQFVEGEWNGLPFAAEFGGQNLPWVLHTAVQEIWHAANMSFGLCPMLTQGAIDLLLAHASPEQKNLFLPRLVSGEWTGTMNLTESQAGSDLSRIRTRALPVAGASGTYRLIGQKIFITYGEHDMAENIIHLVLARLPETPPGVRGISLFIVPKFLVAADGTLARRNDVWCSSLEHKLGIRASPTAAMSLGDDDGAVGYLVGEAHHGLEYMFTMMNNARLAVGLEGVAIAERAYQQARAYARERIQGRSLRSGSGSEAVPIIHHPDIRRMLMTMKALIEAARGLAYYTAAWIDIARRHPVPSVRAEADSRVALLTPIVKAWSTDIGMEVANLGIQVHGGTGFIETTGAAQHLRDARIAAIYEGTNGIQANDLVSRKVLRDGGAGARLMIAEMNAALSAPAEKTLPPLRAGLRDALAALARATDWLVETKDPVAAQAGAVPYLHLFGLTLGGFMFARAVRAMKGLRAAGGNGAFLSAKVVTARFYAERLLPQTTSLLAAVMAGAESVMALPEEDF
ncbi:MAG: putative acyl-CoA dehydrogenase [Rhodospirillaceae bacterium]|nr:MAG: putative acyl-CoA dehydrogenase [Rhodospirillaceae bacterium]